MKIFDFVESQTFLRNYLKQLPHHGHGESLRLAKHLGVSSTYISQILSGRKILTLEQAESLSHYLGQSDLERDYFLLIIQFERAGSQRLKKIFQEKMQGLQQQSLQLSRRLQVDRKLTDEEKAIFYSSGLYSAVHLYSSTQAKGRSIEEIMDRFQLSRHRASGIIKFLIGCGLLVEHAGHFSMTTQSTHLESGSPHLVKHHSNWRHRAIQASEDLSESELMYTVNVSLSQKDFQDLREKMVVFIKDFLEQVHHSPAEEIACLNLDFFWIRS